MNSSKPTSELYFKSLKMSIHISLNSWLLIWYTDKQVNKQISRLPILKWKMFFLKMWRALFHFILPVGFISSKPVRTNNEQTKRASQQIAYLIKMIMIELESEVRHLIFRPQLASCHRINMSNSVQLVSGL